MLVYIDICIFDVVQNIFDMEDPTETISNQIFHEIFNIFLWFDQYVRTYIMMASLQDG